MTIRQELSARGRTTRRVTVVGTSVVIIDSVGSWTSISVETPDQEAYVAEQSPRNLPPYTVGWADGYRGFQVPLQPGDRLETPSAGLLEILAPPVALEKDAGTTGWTAQAQRVEVLYPVTGELQDQGGATLEPEVELAIWDETEQQERSSRYEDFDAEVPPEYDVRVNHQFVIDGRIYKVTETNQELAGPRTVLTLRTQSNG